MKASCRALILMLSCAFGLVGKAFPAQWTYLPEEPLFRPLAADPREVRCGLMVNLKANRLDAAIGKNLPLIRRQSGKSFLEWGIHAAAFPYLKQNELKFPMQENDWLFGTYLSGGRRVFWRFDYTHVSSHLGDALTPMMDPIVYSREFFRLIASEHRGPLRIYLGPGCLLHNIPKEKRPFFQAGVEWTSRPITKYRRLYVAWDLKWKQEAGGVVNHALQGGWQYQDAEKGRTIRLGLVYFHGHSENGQFYLTKEDRLSCGVFFDP